MFGFRPQDTPFEDGEIYTVNDFSSFTLNSLASAFSRIKMLVSVLVLGTFKLQIEFTEEYPNKPPTVRFLSRMFHPNGK